LPTQAAAHSACASSRIDPPSRRRFRLRRLIVVIGGAAILGQDGRYCARNGPSSGTLMRHFLLLPLTPSALARRVPMRPAVASLIARPGAA
jgi:hypothetical protein